MIDVPQESKLETVKTAASLYGELLGYYGRLLRVQTMSSEYNTDHISYDFDADDYRYSMRRIVHQQDRFGRLIGAWLNESSGWVEEGEEPSGFSGKLGVVLEGQKNIVLHELSKGRILLFQEDAHQWVPIFRGENWKEVQR